MTTSLHVPTHIETVSHPFGEPLRNLCGKVCNKNINFNPKLTYSCHRRLGLVTLELIHQQTTLQGKEGPSMRKSFCPSQSTIVASVELNGGAIEQRWRCWTSQQVCQDGESLLLLRKASVEEALLQGYTL